MFIWDYDKKELEKTAKGRLFLLERQINYGPEAGTRIRLTEVKKNWAKLNLFKSSRRLMELLIWGNYQTSPINKN